MPDLRPRRSLLYLPASNSRAIAKSRTLAADVVILDLEDAVAPAMKEHARVAAVSAVTEGGWGRREVLIRVNALSTPWSAADFAAVSGSNVSGIVLPKVESSEEAAQAVRWAELIPVWAMIETPKGVLAADAIAAVPGIKALVAGTSDLTKDLRVRPGNGRLPLLYALSRIVLSARAYGLLVFDGVFTDLNDTTGFEAEALQGHELGFDGKTLIHPRQIEATNKLFAPSPAEIVFARGLIDEYDSAYSHGHGVTTFSGKLVEPLHVESARFLLEVAAAIERLGDDVPSAAD